MKWIIERFREPSTYAGFALLLQGISMYLSGDKANGFTTAAGGAAAMFLQEKPAN